MSTNAAEILEKLHALANPTNVAGMARFGISAQGTLGVSMAALRKIAKGYGKNHELADELWSSGIHEARLMACLLDQASKVDEAQMERWVVNFDSWDICDQVCLNLFVDTPFAYQKAIEWSERDEEFVKRAGFVLMAVLAVHDKKADDQKFIPFLPIILREANDDRNFVKKAVNWALRQIGKRNQNLNRLAIEAAEEMLHIESRSTRWTAGYALKELKSEKALRRMKG